MPKLSRMQGRRVFDEELAAFRWLASLVLKSLSCLRRRLTVNLRVESIFAVGTTLCLRDCTKTDFHTASFVISTLLATSSFLAASTGVAFLEGVGEVFLEEASSSVGPGLSPDQMSFTSTQTAGQLWLELFKIVMWNKLDSRRSKTVQGQSRAWCLCCRSLKE